MILADIGILLVPGIAVERIRIAVIVSACFPAIAFFTAASVISLLRHCRLFWRRIFVELRHLRCFFHLNIGSGPSALCLER
jgi:hypothetical protein